MGEAWTIRRLVDWMAKDFAARGLPSARLDADLLLAHALGKERIALYLDLDRPLSESELTDVRELVRRRRAREPIAYITGRREFWGRGFRVTPAVLVPRPETETLVERALALLDPDANGRVLDLCTGSGCIGITLACERASIRVDATDISADAAAVARENAAALGVPDRVTVLVGDLFAPVDADARHVLVTANPPYVADRELAALEADVAKHEPKVALAAGDDGLATIRRIAAEAPQHLSPGGTLLCEVGAGQAASVVALFERAGLREVKTHRDLAGVERVVEGALSGSPL